MTEGVTISVTDARFAVDALDESANISDEQADKYDQLISTEKAHGLVSDYMVLADECRQEATHQRIAAENIEDNIME